MSVASLAILSIALTGGAPVGITLGETHAKSCYDAAEAGNTSRFALASCERALAVQPLSAGDKASTLVNRGIIRMNRGEYNLADRDFAEALKLDASQAEAYLNAAILALRRADSARALTYSSRSIELETRKPHIAYYVRGMANEDRGAASAAYRDLQMAQSLAPGWDVPAIELTRYSVVTR
ncbi:hypothetical protein WJT74_04140 [Sphingomicrobium sp. XHP0239]|uniref:tetratricopeptide repeat protein n=1 Tax=Sphingomicrobium maritimum TaxID=3133972 RepID=UPI0031CC9206